MIPLDKCQMKSFKNNNILIKVKIFCLKKFFLEKSFYLKTKFLKKILFLEKKFFYLWHLKVPVPNWQLGSA